MPDPERTGWCSHEQRDAEAGLPRHMRQGKTDHIFHAGAAALAIASVPHVPSRLPESPEGEQVAAASRLGVSELRGHSLSREHLGATTRSDKLNGKPWSKREDHYMRQVYPHVSTKALADALQRSICSVNGRAYTLGLKKSTAYMASPAACRLRRGDNVGWAHRFPKGHVPWTAGRKVGTRGRSGETQFKKGQRPPKWLPIGTVKMDSDGYLRRKIAEGLGGSGNAKVWEFVHRRVWEEAHGPIPKGMRIWWKDGNHFNCALENLELLRGADHMARTTIHNYPPELKQVMRLAGKLRRKLEERANAEEHDRGSAQPPVRDAGSAGGSGEAHGY
jgi:hypothetical protein